MNNPAVIVSENGVILIDPGSTLGVGEQVLAELTKITDKPVLAVFNTHIHGDHWLANHAIANAYPQAKIYAHADMKAQAADQGLVWLDLMARLTEGLSSNTELVVPGHTLVDGADIEIDGQHLRIHANIPAHTNTDIMIEHLNSKTVFLGDNCFRDRFGQFDTSSGIGGNIEALERVLALDIKQFVPGHGKSGSRDEVVEPYLNYLRLLNEVTAAGFEEDLQGYEIKQANLARFESWQDWQGFETYLGKHIDKMYLEIEEKAW
jgi:glyoxylase-like metal-dependent hydrolase (beta-lactamase superfamily II)